MSGIVQARAAGDSVEASLRSIGHARRLIPRQFRGVDPEADTLRPRFTTPLCRPLAGLNTIPAIPQGSRTRPGLHAFAHCVGFCLTFPTFRHSDTPDIPDVPTFRHSDMPTFQRFQTTPDISDTHVPTFPQPFVIFLQIRLDAL